MGLERSGRAGEDCHRCLGERQGVGDYRIYTSGLRGIVSQWTDDISFGVDVPVAANDSPITAHSTSAGA